MTFGEILEQRPLNDIPYEAFVRGKVDYEKYFGFDIDESELSPSLLPHQRDLVRWAVKGGRRALFESFGLGKTIQALEICRLILKHKGGKALIVCPLGVRQEFQHDAETLLDGLTVTPVRRDSELDGDGIYITNYESVRDGRLHVDGFTVVSLDEASVLRSYGSKTYQSFLGMFKTVPYRYVATATPAPNRFKELIHYAGFLGVMDTGEALTRFFKRDSTKANNLTIYPHKQQEFRLWLHSWAAFVTRPSDLGYEDTGYDLPPLDMNWIEVNADDSRAVDTDNRGNVALYADAAVSLSAEARVRRDSTPARVEKVAQIITRHSPISQCVVWCDLNYEQDELENMCKQHGWSYSSVRGSQSEDVQERELEAWKNKDRQILIGKPIMLGSGLNLQQCNKAIFAGLSYKFNDFIQAVHRIQRFGQTRTCHIWAISAQSERGVRDTLKRKWKDYEVLRDGMEDVMKQYKLSRVEIADALKKDLGVERVEAGSSLWTFVNNDCVEETKRLDDDSVDEIVTSIPFSNHYEYTPNYNDFGSTAGNREFWEQMDYLTPQLYRVLKPGRVYCCHVKDRILFGNATGTGLPTVDPFHAQAIAHGLKHGFDFIGMITVVTDVVRENNQTYRLGWSEQCKDGTKMGVGCPEYVLLFHKPQTDRSKGYADIPVAKSKDDYSRARWQVDAHAFWRSSGNRHISPDEYLKMDVQRMSKTFTEETMRKIYDYESHVKIAETIDGEGRLPATFMALAPGSWAPDVWTDIVRMRTLNLEQSKRAQTLHVCLAKGSLVLTATGYKPIEQVKVGELVLTHRNRWRPVEQVQCTGVREVVKVKAQGVPGLTLTPDHKLWAKQVTMVSQIGNRAASVEPDWLEAKDCGGSYVNMKDLPGLPVAENPDTELWWMVGRWIADGHMDKRGQAIISVGRDKWADFENHLGRFAGATPSEGSALQLQLHDEGHVLRDIVEQCGNGASNKHLPPQAFSLDLESMKALLAGYLSGDGFYVAERGTWMATSVSRRLVMEIAVIAQTVYGTIPSIHPGKPERDCVIEGRTVHAHQEWVVSFDDNSRSRRKKPFILDDGAWKKVRSVEPAGTAETWNLRVAEDHSYVAEGCVVKNCPLQIDLVERLIRRYSNPGELVYDPFGGIGTVPSVAVRMDRKGYGVELNTQYWSDGVAYCKAAQQDVTMPTLFDLEGVDTGVVD
ncbi:DNA methyltransferase [Bifidobacterium sp. UTBIF-68]|uniref:DNA methyltransferase n=1 Tax=Bifidobacterium sp. UTBIF-68 TaxID=1465262 RepID=UPI00112D5959|nr:DNA methyltransferase [Bifidobacterium sp. UTBIF-68]